MKKYFFKVASILLFVATLTSCEDDKIIYPVDNGQSLVGFTTFSGNAPAFEDPALKFTYELEVGSTNRVDYDRAVALTINQELTNALPSQYTIEDAQYVIPAGEFTTKIKIVGHYNALPANGTKVNLVFDLVSVQDSDIVDAQKTRFTVLLFRACPIVRDEFIGTYNAVEDGDRYEVVATAGAAANELLLSNIANLNPDSVTHVFLGADVANPILGFPPSFPTSKINFLVSDFQGEGATYVNGASGSTFYSCLHTITLVYNLQVAAGAFQASTIVLTKK